MPFHRDAEGQINSLINDLLVLPNIDHDTVEVNNGVNRIQGTGLPVVYSLNNAVGDLGNER